MYLKPSIQLILQLLHAVVRKIKHAENSRHSVTYRCPRKRVGRESTLGTNLKLVSALSVNEYGFSENNDGLLICFCLVDHISTSHPSSRCEFNHDSVVFFLFYVFKS